MKNILLISTGGTIASTPSENGLAPSLSGKELISLIPGIEEICNLEEISIFSIDSTNMNPDLTIEIARTIKDNYDRYDGFVVSHGTDTMAYTSGLLSYLLMGINKPVIITGAQVPIVYSNTDAKNNILDALRFSIEDISGVYIAFNGKLILGTRAKKVKSQNKDAFESIDFPLAGKINDNKANINPELKLSRPYPGFINDFNFKLDPNILIIKLFPGIDPRIFNFIEKNYSGVIIESFGVGGIPNSLVDELNHLIDNGKYIVISTQCMNDGVTLNVYEVGSRLQEEMIIDGADMTTEALSSKLMFALSNFNDFHEIKDFIETPIFYDRNS